MEASAKRPRSEDALPEDELVQLDVGGTEFTTMRSTLTKYPDSFLGRMFSGDWKTRGLRTPKGSLFIDRSPVLFAHVLQVLRSCTEPSAYRMPDKRSIGQALWNDELRFYGLDDPRKPVRLDRRRAVNAYCGALAKDFAAQVKASTVFRQKYGDMLATNDDAVCVWFIEGDFSLSAEGDARDAARWICKLLESVDAEDEDDDDDEEERGTETEAVSAVREQLAEYFGCGTVRLFSVNDPELKRDKKRDKQWMISDPKTGERRGVKTGPDGPYAARVIVDFG